MEKTITLTVNGTDLVFTVNNTAYDQYMNELQPGNKVAPCRNFLFRVVHPDSKEALKGILEKPGAALQLTGHLVQDFAPELEVLVGK